jgi:di/tricarboxylate transporter
MSTGGEGEDMVTADPATLVVLALIAGVVVSFALELVPPDVTAIGVVVALVALRPVTGLTVDQALSGFSNPATLVVAASYMLSEGIVRTGLVRRLGRLVERLAAGDPTRLLASVVGVSGVLAGVVTNTPIVAVFVPLVTDLADRVHVSPSKLLIPLSFAAMMGGTLTLVGTSTNLLASGLAGELIGRRFSIFEFTPLGAVVLLVGSLYLVTVGRRLLPERIEPAVDLLEEFGISDGVGRLYVREDSPAAGRPIESVVDPELDLDVLQIRRDGERIVIPDATATLAAGDVLTVRGSRETRRRFAQAETMWPLPWVRVTEFDLHVPEGRGTLIEAVVAGDSRLAGRTIADVHLRQRYGVAALAVRHGETIVSEGLPDVELTPGDGVLLYAAPETVETLRAAGDLFVTEVARPHLAEDETRTSESYRTGSARWAVAVGVGVLTAAALDVPLVAAALAGVVAMVVTDAVRPAEAYGAVQWDVIFLLAGMIPLGAAFQATGGTDLLAGVVRPLALALPPLAVLLLYYGLTALVANVLGNAASVVLVLPVAVESARTVGADPFSFAIGVTFAASTAFLSPVSYQTNLMVYSPGGYRFTDFARVGAPLQVLLALVTTAGVAVIWGV